MDVQGMLLPCFVSSRLIRLGAQLCKLRFTSLLPCQSSSYISMSCQQSGAGAHAPGFLAYAVAYFLTLASAARGFAAAVVHSAASATNGAEELVKVRLLQAYLGTYFERFLSGRLI